MSGGETMGELKNSENQIGVLLRAILLGTITYVLLLLILDGVFLFTSLSEAYMGWAAAAALCVGCFFTGIKAGRGFGKRGLLWGLMAGALLIALTMTVMKLTGGIDDISEISGVKSGVCILFGGLGGMIGVNR